MKKINISILLFTIIVNFSPSAFAKSGSSHHEGHAAPSHSRSEEHVNSADDAKQTSKGAASKKRGAKKPGGICFSCVH